MNQPAFQHLDLPDLPGIIFDLIGQIPAGRVTTYGILAQALGDDQARSARWIGGLLRDHVHREGCRCHRVVRKEGDVGLHVSGDPKVKLRLLRQEGIRIHSPGWVDMANPFREFISDHPLRRLRELQRQLASRASEIPLPARPQTVAGIDVAYRADGTACAAYVLLDAASRNVLDQLTLERRCEFPYIPGYLTFRELPVMRELCEQARERGRLADVIFCDGNGRLHPWRAGIATCLGVLLDHPVIGVGKSLLCGRVDLGGRDRLIPGKPRPVLDADEPIGMALVPATGGKSLYVSVGNRITLGEAVNLVQRMRTTHRLPEPLHLADRLSKRAKQSIESA